MDRNQTRYLRIVKSGENSSIESREVRKRKHLEMAQKYYDDLLITSKRKISKNPLVKWFSEKLDEFYIEDVSYLRNPEELANIMYLVRYAKRYIQNSEEWWGIFLVNYFLETRKNGNKLSNTGAIEAHVDRLYSDKTSFAYRELIFKFAGRSKKRRFRAIAFP